MFRLDVLADARNIFKNVGRFYDPPAPGKKEWGTPVLYMTGTAVSSSHCSRREDLQPWPSLDWALCRPPLPPTPPPPTPPKADHTIPLCAHTPSAQGGLFAHTDAFRNCSQHCAAPQQKVLLEENGRPRSQTRPFKRLPQQEFNNIKATCDLEAAAAWGIAVNER